MKRLSLFSLMICLTFIATIAWSNIIHVPGDQPTIQAGIDAAVDGDTVLVANGTYKGNGNRNLNFTGKAITVTSENGADNCIIDCLNGKGFAFTSGESETSVVSGFTITNGATGGGTGLYYTSGAGIYCGSSSPTITNNIITGNTASSGGGISCANSSSPTITNNTIMGNSAGTTGGGIYCAYSSSPIITNNAIMGNSGGGIHCYFSSSPAITNNTITGNSGNNVTGGIQCSYSSSPTITNNTITGNSTNLSTGGGIYCDNNSSPTVTNTILWNDNPQEIYHQVNSSITVTYSDVQGGWEGEGNIDADPEFVDPQNGDYRLSDYSPCIGAGIMTPSVPVTDIEGNPRPNPGGSNPDIGAYENARSTPILRPSILEKVSGDNQRGDVDSVLPNQLVVRVLDQRSDPMAGVTVNFSPSEGASVNPISDETDADGRAQTTLTLGAYPGDYNVTVSVAGYPELVEEFTATAFPIETVGTFTVEFENGLNMISLPNHPNTPYTAKSFAEEIGSVTLIFRFDRNTKAWIPYVPGFDTDDGFSIACGEGYIVNVTASKSVVFTGTVCDDANPAPRREWSPGHSENGTLLRSASPTRPGRPNLFRNTWAFVVAGELPIELRRQNVLSPAENLTISVRNLNRGIRRVGSLYPTENGTGLKPSPTASAFHVAFVDVDRSAVVEAGDRLLVEVTDADGRLVAEKLVAINPTDLANAYKIVNPRYNPIPNKTELLQNFPNPFNPETWLPYKLASDSPLSISIYNPKGQLLRTLHLGLKKAGIYTTKDRAAYWDGKDNTGDKVSSGVYFYTFRVGEYRATRKMAIMK